MDGVGQSRNHGRLENQRNGLHPRKKKQEEQNTVWKTKLESEPHEAEAEPKKPGVVALQIDLETAFEQV